MNEELKRTCETIHDFSLLLTDGCFIVNEDEIRLHLAEEGRIKVPSYYLADTKISGFYSLNCILIDFPKDMFPLPKKKFGDLRASLSKVKIELGECTKKWCSDHDTNWQYFFRYAGAKPKNYGKGLTASVNGEFLGYDWLGYIRETGYGSNCLDLHYNMIKEDKDVEKILEAIIIDGLDLDVE